MTRTATSSATSTCRATASQREPGPGDPHHQRLRRLQGRPGRDRRGLRRAAATPCCPTPASASAAPSCKITLDDPDFDGIAGRQLVSYLGGARASPSSTPRTPQPAPALQVVDARPPRPQRRRPSHRPARRHGRRLVRRPIQFAIASVDPRLDTIVPMITWNDLSYCLAPNNTDQTAGVSTGDARRGQAVLGARLLALGVAERPAERAGPTRRACSLPQLRRLRLPRPWSPPGRPATSSPATSPTCGTPRSRRTSRKIKIPTLLIQGENDTLFNLNEAIATYQALQAQGTEVKMIWQSWGHSGDPAPGEIDLDNPTRRPSTRPAGSSAGSTTTSRTAASAPGRSSPTSATGSTTPATRRRPTQTCSPTFPVGTSRTYYLSGSGDLVLGQPHQARLTVVPHHRRRRADRAQHPRRARQLLRPSRVTRSRPAGHLRDLDDARAPAGRSKVVGSPVRG